MANTYAPHVSTKQTPQSEPIPGKPMVPNSAGGFVFAVDDWTRLDRFLILGNEGGTYYASEKQLTIENAGAVARCLAADGFRTVERICAVSASGRAPKQDPAIFALAIAAATKGSPSSGFALAAMPRVCRTGTHLFQFAAAVQELRGWGRGLRRAIGSWYTGHAPRDLAYQCVKYQQRDGWAHRDLLRLSHPKVGGNLQEVLHWVVKGWPEVGAEPHPQADLLPIWAFERAKRATTAGEVVQLIRKYRLVRECVPTQFLTDPGVWEALLEEMPLGALVRNLATMTRVGLIAPMSAGTAAVCARLVDDERLRKARIHPIAVLSAMLTYASGRSARGKGEWIPEQLVVDALDAAFYKAFGNVTATGKRWLLGIDVSGSMTSGAVAGVPGLTPRTAAAAMALVTAATERHHHFMAFSGGFVPLNISPRQRLSDVCRTMDGMPFDRTDCALPVLYALQRKIPVEVFAVYTDNETWAGSIHPCQALQRYRQEMGIGAKLVVVGMTATGFSIADPADAGMMDVVGFDTATPELMSNFAVS